MKVIFENKFLKDIKNLDFELSLRLKNIILHLEDTSNITNIDNLRKIIGLKDYYRIRLGDYRLGLKIKDNICYCIRIKHRKDIYKLFP